MQTSKNSIALVVNRATVTVPVGASVAAAILGAGFACRTSVTGQPRAPLCGMGICMECRATVDGAAHVRTCQLEARQDMKVTTL